MKRTLVFGGALAALATAYAIPASAAQPTGWYGALDLGYHQPDTVKVSGMTGADVKLNGDVAAFGRVGYRIDPHWRVELEGGYRPSTVDNAGASGHQNVGSVMANLIYDFMPDSRLQPFVGVGMGAEFLRVKQSFPANSTFVTKSDNERAWQGLAGVSYAATDRLNVDLTYRYFVGDNETVNCGGACPPTSVHYGDYRDNSVTVGLRYAFSPPPAPPPPPPAPAFAAKQFVVYFPFDQSTLTPEAQTIVQQAAQYAHDGHATRIVVVGHTDASGSAKYNLRLSERRAKAVADALIGLGVPQTVLSADWKGKADLAVQTPDGVKEPLNRRSTIDINF